MHRLPFVFVCVSWCALARADEPARDGETIVITDAKPAEAARDADRALADAPFVTVLHPDEHGAAATVADAAAQAPGVQVRSLGGSGSYQSISIRGTASGDTTVLVDGVPLARLAAVTTDLGRYALDAFARVDIYRGAVPVELGGAGLGGAVDLVSRVGRDPRAAGPLGGSVGLGSYGARHARAHYADDLGPARTAATIGYAHADGDYTFFDNRGTQLNPRDDRYATRANNGFTQLDGAARALVDDDGGGVRAAYRTQGLPGSIQQPTMRARLATLDAIADGRIRRGGLGALAYALVEREHLDDPANELGLGAQDRSSLTLSGGATVAAHVAASARAHLTLGAEARGDRYADRAPGDMGTHGTRVGGALLAQAALQLAPDLEVTPAVRVEVLRTNPAALTVGPTAFEPVAARTDVLPSPRLTAKLALADALALKATAGWYARVPTLVELFGNRGFLLGTPDLRPERGPTGDFGGVWAPTPASAASPIDRILVEADVFATRARDTIGYVTYGGFASRAANLGLVQTYGAELAASVRLARLVSLVGSYARVATEQITNDVTLDGRALPRTPGHRLYARATVASARYAAWTDVAYQSTSYLDPANLGEVPARALAGAGVSVALPGHLALALAVENALDTRVQQLPLVPPPSPALTSAPVALADLAGYPLPGRSFYLSLAWNH